MTHKFKKVIVSLVAASMLFQQCGMLGLAAETETATQAVTEQQTQASTEAPQTETQAPTEAQTQAPTEAPQTESQTTTEAQTQAPTEAPQTESQAATEAPGTETQTEEKTEKEEKETESETETEKETERSDRVNDGDKISDSTLVSGLQSAFPYLFAAESVTISEELAEDQSIAEGSEGSGIAGGLAGFSRKLANGQSTSMVCVINIYADKKGKLDTKQLEAAFKNQVIDVTNQYFVINIVAADKNQTISFSGYDMTNAGQSVSYEEETQPGDILYNFVALEKDKYVSFEGTVNLSSGSGLQGTFLAPSASVSVDSDLAGAVYAGSVTVGSGVTELLRIVLIQGSTKEEETETEEAAGKKAETEGTSESSSEEESGTETNALAGVGAVAAAEESGSETETTTETKLMTEDETTAETETEVSTETETGTEQAAESELETESETGIEMELAVESESETEMGTEKAVESESETESESGTELSAESESETESETAGTEENPVTGDLGEDVVIDDSGEVETQNFLWYSQTGTTLRLRLTEKGAASAAALSGGKISIKAAGNIYKEDNTVAYGKDEEVTSYTWTTAADGSVTLQYGGSYYLEVTQLPTQTGVTYLTPSRIYFGVDEQGALKLDAASAAYTWQDSLLSIPLEQTAQAVIKLTNGDDGTGTDLTGTFVVKDSTGKILRDANGYPSYYIDYTSTHAGSGYSIAGLAAGTYLLSQVKAQGGYATASDTSFTVEASQTSPKTVNVKNTLFAGGSKNLKVTGQSTFKNTTLTAEKESSFYAALFSDDKLTARVSEVKSLNYLQGDTATDTATFSGLTAGTYYLGVTDEFGEALTTGQTYTAQISGQTNSQVVIAAADTDKTVTLVRAYTTYPENDFSYEAEIQITMNVKDHAGAAKKVTETFYANLYRDAAFAERATAQNIVFAMNGVSSLTVTARVKMTVASGTLYIAETDSSGAVITSDNANFSYGISYPTHMNQSILVACGSSANVTVQNQLNNTVVTIHVRDASSKAQISGAKLAVKDKSTGQVISVANATTFTSESSAKTWTNQLAAGTYLLTEITAPSGYTCTPDVEFTVTDGRTTEVVMENSKTATSSYKITVSKQVYSGDHLVYARDTSTGTYAAEGCYTFYAALFSDAARTKKVSDVQKITVSALVGTTEFKNLKSGSTYYVGETDEYGILQTSTGSCTVKYSSSGKITMSSTSRQAVIQNVYSSLPRGYRYTATLTLTKKLQNSSGEAESTTKSFYAGIYRQADYSDTPTIVELKLNNSSEASSKRRILLSGSSDMTYYIAEVDANGNRITDSSDFGYTVSIDQPQVTLSRSDDKNVTITNKAKVSKVTLYITKRVYQGTAQKAVNETFYAGLFKDAAFTELYANPIPLQLSGKSEMTLKLSLNLGSATEATIYIAEVDKNGKVVQAGADFGYDIRVVNATAAFTQEKTEIQSVLLNSVYGTTSSDQWNSIISQNEGDGDYVSSNGSSSSSSAQTGDDTPILPYVIALAAAIVVIGGVLVFSRKRKKK